MEKTVIYKGFEGGMDARHVAETVQLASRYESSLHILYNNVRANLKSIMGMMALHLCRGDEITLVAEGADETKALEDLQAYFCNER